VKFFFGWKGAVVAGSGKWGCGKMGDFLMAKFPNSLIVYRDGEFLNGQTALGGRPFDKNKFAKNFDK